MLELHLIVLRRAIMVFKPSSREQSIKRTLVDKLCELVEDLLGEDDRDESVSNNDGSVTLEFIGRGHEDKESREVESVNLLIDDDEDDVQEVTLTDKTEQKFYDQLNKYFSIKELEDKAAMLKKEMDELMDDDDDLESELGYDKYSYDDDEEDEEEDEEDEKRVC